MSSTNELFSEEDRSDLDLLLTESKLYHTSKDFKELLEFVIRLRNMAPFNGMLLQIQKPGLSYAASRLEWQEQFNRTIKPDARPLLIMWPFGPVALVYDIQDTEGEPLPRDAFAFHCAGDFSHDRIDRFLQLLEKKKIQIEWFDGGDNHAGAIQRTDHPKDEKSYTPYSIKLNKNHPPTTLFATIVHELAHLYLGHLGDDQKLKIKAREREPDIREIEAESVAYLVCKRNRAEPRSSKYLNSFVDNQTTTENIDLYAITRSAGRIERLLELSNSVSIR